MQILGYMALVVVGFLAGMWGIGGSILAVPILVFAFSRDIVTASACALFVTATTSLAGFMMKHRREPIDIQSAIGFGAPSFATTFATRKWILPEIPSRIHLGAGISMSKDDLLLALLCALMAISAATMIFRTTRKVSYARSSNLLLLSGPGTVVGVLSGLTGAGGGFLILPSLLYFGRVPHGIAISTTLLLISANASVGFYGHMLSHSVSWPFILSASAAAIIGLLLGHRAGYTLSHFASPHCLGWVLASVCIFTIIARFLC